MSDPFRYDDAAYVLGALSPDEHAAFEAHLETCDECRLRVAEARAATDLLTGLTVTDAADPGPVPDTLLPGLLRAARRERSRGRWITGSLGAVAAACITALVVVLWPGGSDTAAPPPALAFTQVQPVPVTATATLVAKPWGTEIELNCRYAEGIEESHPYRLVVFDTHNHRYDAGSWMLGPGGPIEFTTGTSLRAADISRMQITLADGSPILQLKL
jgi:hypothetical protein